MNMFKSVPPEEWGDKNIRVSEDTVFLDEIAQLVEAVRELGGLVEKAIEVEEEFDPTTLEEAEGLGRLHENLNTLAAGMFRHAQLIEMTLKLFGK